RMAHGDVKSIVDSPWTSVGTSDTAREYLVLLTYLPLKRYRKMLTLVRRSWAASHQLAKTPGLIGFTFRAKLFRHRFWTLSAWEDEKALMDFVGKVPHRDTMKVLGPRRPWRPPASGRRPHSSRRPRTGSAPTLSMMPSRLLRSLGCPQSGRSRACRRFRPPLGSSVHCHPRR